MSIPLTFVYNQQKFDVQADNNETVISIFEQVKKNFNFTENSENYVLLCPFLVEINQQTVKDAFKNLLDPNEIYITLKTDSQQMKEFCQKMFPFLRYKAIMIDNAAIDLLDTLHVMHRKVMNIYNSTFDFKSIVPKNLFDDSKDLESISKLNQWFSTVFQWRGPHQCQHCRGKVEFHEIRPPTKKEKELGAAQVIRYFCSHCQSALRVPDYENPEIIFQNIKSGFSGEFCIVFGTILRQFGFHVRLLKNFGFNHYWLEVFVPSLQRYVHVDPVMGTTNAPLQLEIGTKCHISHIVAVGPYECSDMTYRYTKNMEAILQEREEYCHEEVFQQILSLRNSMWSYGLSESEKSEVESRIYADMEYSPPDDIEISDQEKIPIDKLDIP